MKKLLFTLLIGFNAFGLGEADSAHCVADNGLHYDVIFNGQELPSENALSRMLRCEDIHADVTFRPMNCVNPGGGCDGSVPCCDSYNNACVRGRCQPVGR